MDQKSKDQIAAELAAEYREAIRRTAAEEEAARRGRKAGGDGRTPDILTRVTIYGFLCLLAAGVLGVAYMLWIRPS